MDLNLVSQRRLLVEITDAEHTLILLMRTMDLNEISCAIELHNFFPIELPDKDRHITNMINMSFKTSHQLHTIKAAIEFITTHSAYARAFQQYDLHEIIERYQSCHIAESAGVYKYYLKPFSEHCIKCGEQLTSTFSHRAKTVLSLTGTYQARKKKHSFRSS